jgi:hypothetical protein
LMMTVVSCNNEANMTAIRIISGKFNWSWNKKKNKDEWHFVAQKYDYNIVVLRDKMAHREKLPLSLENKILIYETTLRPVWTYGIELWGCANKSNIGCPKKIVPFPPPRCPVCGEWCKLHWLLLDTPTFDWNTRRSRGHKIFKMAPTKQQKSFCAVEYAKTTSVITVQRNFRRQIEVDPPDNTRTPLSVGICQR